jgi:hypothetical protein
MRMTLEMSGLKEAQARFDGFSDRRLRAVGATALTRTANRIASAQRDEITRVFDRPKPYTLGGVGIKTANAGDLNAEVFLRVSGSTGRGAGKYLQAQVQGGSGAVKGFERKLQGAGIMPAGWRAIPAQGARLDPFGNLEKRQLDQIIVQIREMRTEGPRSKAGTNRRFAAVRRAGAAFFAVLPGQRKGLSPGVYGRTAYGAGRDIVPILIFVSSVRYRLRFDFYGIALRVAQAALPEEFGRAFDESAARLAAKGSS